MPKKDFIFTKEMAELLKKIRIKASLSQTEVAERIGLSSKTKDSYISHLEKGRLKNPALGLILLYLRACGESWPEFFKQLDTIDFKMRHEKMISQVKPPPAERKIQRDAMRFEIGVEFPSKEKEEVDFERLKKQIKDKVTALVSKENNTLSSVLSHRGRGEDATIADYQKFALEYFEFLATLNKAGIKMVADKYQRAGLKLNLLFKIKKIINSVLRGEIKRISAKKPLPTCLCRWHGRQAEKQEKMAIGLTKYRIRIERIEAEVHKLLCDLSVPTPWFALYKDSARECYRVLKKYYGKNQELLNKTLVEISERWNKEGLKEDVLLKVRDKVISVFGSLRLKGMV